MVYSNSFNFFLKIETFLYLYSKILLEYGCGVILKGYTRCFICNKRINEGDKFVFDTDYSVNLHKRIVIFLCLDEIKYLHLENPKIRVYKKVEK